MEAEGEPPVQAVQSHICTRWTRLLGGWTSSFSASLDGCAPGLAGQDARQWGSRSGFSLPQGPEESERPGSTHHQSHRPSHWAFDVQPPLAHDDGDERGGQVLFLDALISSGSLFGPAVEGFAERFTEAQKSSQAMRHFLPKRTSSSSASSRPRSALTPQTAKPRPTAPDRRESSARRYLFLKRQGPGPRSPWIRHLRNPPEQPGRPPRKQPLLCLSSARLGKCVHGSSRAHYSAQVSDHCDSGQNKTHTFSKREQNLFLPTISVLPLCSQSAQPFQPLATRAEAWQAIPGVSKGVMTTVRRGYTLQFTRRPPRFRGVLATTVRSENAQVLRAEVMNLLEKGAIEIVPPAQSDFPQKYGGLQPILDLRLLNYALMKRLFRMITLKQILPQICPGIWFMSLDFTSR